MRNTDISPEVPGNGESAYIALGRSILRHIRIKREIEMYSREKERARGGERKWVKPASEIASQEKSFEGDARHTIDLHEVAKKDQTRETSILLINLESFFPWRKDKIFLYSLKSLLSFLRNMVAYF